MSETRDLSRPVPSRFTQRSDQVHTFTHPDDVLHNRSLSLGEKRALLAAWASDAHAVPNLPAMRQLDSGAIVSIDAVLDALRALDASDDARPRKAEQRASAARPRLPLVFRWRRSLRSRDHDDDDDPPPCPASAIPPGIELELRRRRDAAWNLKAA
jgi:hypothetical protein